jgi:hypothetical protein
MNAFEKILLAVLATAAAEAPIFVHSAHGMIVLNAGETLVANILASLQKPAVSAPVAPVVAH